jgi:hypothetical protein
MTTWVRVEWPSVEDVFLNRLFARPAGRTQAPFRVEVGSNRFSLLKNDALFAEVVAVCPQRDKDNPFSVTPLPIAAMTAAALAPEPVETAAPGARRKPAGKAKKAQPKRKIPPKAKAKPKAKAAAKSKPKPKSKTRAKRVRR